MTRQSRSRRRSPQRQSHTRKVPSHLTPSASWPRCNRRVRAGADQRTRLGGAAARQTQGKRRGRRFEASRVDLPPAETVCSRSNNTIGAVPWDGCPSLAAAWIGTRDSVLHMITVKPFRLSSAGDVASLGRAIGFARCRTFVRRPLGTRTKAWSSSACTHRNSRSRMTSTMFEGRHRREASPIRSPSTTIGRSGVGSGITGRRAILSTRPGACVINGLRATSLPADSTIGTHFRSAVRDRVSRFPRRGVRVHLRLTDVRSAPSMTQETKPLNSWVIPLRPAETSRSQCRDRHDQFQWIDGLHQVHLKAAGQRRNPIV